MGKWLSKFSNDTPGDRTDKPDILPPELSVSGMSGSFPSMLPENSSLSPENLYCDRCGGGYWIRPTEEAPYQYGRCVLSETPVETLYVPGGTAHPKAQSETVKESALPTVELTTKPDGSPLSGIYWEASNGLILGPAAPEFIAQDGSSFWISVTFEEAIWWINADRLRSKKAFAMQRRGQPVQLHRDSR